VAYRDSSRIGGDGMSPYGGDAAVVDRSAIAVSTVVEPFRALRGR
jgi:hypothetical protein